MAASARFRFGENWQSFVATVDEDRIRAAEEGLLRLLPRGAIYAELIGAED